MALTPQAVRLKEKRRRARELSAARQLPDAMAVDMKGRVVGGEASSWDAPHAQYEVRGINHRQAYSEAGACTNMAEEYFSRLRRAEAGHHHHIAGVHPLIYALKRRHGARIIAERRTGWAGDEARAVRGFLRLLAAALEGRVSRPGLASSISWTWKGY